MPVLARSLAHQGAPRVVKPGEYHVSDLLQRPAAQIAAWHRGDAAPDGIPPWLAARGLAMEDAALAGLDPIYRNPTVRLNLGNGASIIGHPDSLEPLNDRSWLAQEWELGEVKSQLSAEDEAREDLALDQGLAYVALLKGGARVTFGKGIEEAFAPRRVVTVNVILAGVYDARERPFSVDDGVLNGLLAYMTAKARLIHAETTRIGPPHLAELQVYDAAHPPRGDPDYAVPVAEGEEASLADETVAAYVAWKDWEAKYEALRARWQATLNLATRPKVKAPTGGSIGLVKKTEAVLDEVAWKAAGGAEAAEAAQRLRSDLLASPLARGVAAAESKANELRRVHTTLRDVAGHIRVYPPKGGRV